jgi:hypothetical protein
MELSIDRGLVVVEKDYGRPSRFLNRKLIDTWPMRWVTIEEQLKLRMHAVDVVGLV